MAIDFTGTGPITGGGQVFVKNANGEWEKANVTAPGVVVQTFTASGTYTPSPGMIFCIVEAVGGGGGGGGVANAGASVHTRAGGGGGGAYVRSLLTAADIGASQTVTIGAGGSGGAAGANDGSAGGNTSLGSLVVADAGEGGIHGDPTDGGWGGAGGTAAGSTGDIKIPGDYGGPGLQGDVSDYWYGSMGGGASGGGFGWSGGSPYNWHEGAGEAGVGYGGGGGGASEIGTTDRAGGAGSSGIIIITEYIRQSVLSPIAYNADGTPLLDLSTDGQVNPGAADDATLGATGRRWSDLYLADGGYVDWNGSGGRISYVNADNDMYFDVGNGDSYTWRINSSQHLILDATGFVNLQGSNLGHSSFPWGAIYTNTGLYVGGTGSANLLDDYEEGTWTPAFTASGTGFTSLSYDIQVGTYTKVGNVCTINVSLDVAAASTLGSPTGTLRISGLPFTAENVTNTYYNGCGDAYSFISTREPNVIQTNVNTSYLILILAPSAANADAVDAVDLGTASELYMSLTYRTA